MINLPKVVKRRKKRLGRGYGSGKGGHTVGRGQKGQKARDKVPILFEGMKVKKSLLKRLPLQRGKGKFKSRKKPIIVKLSLLNLYTNGSRVDIESLAKANIVTLLDAKELGVKILGDGEITKSLKVAVPCSKAVAKKILKAGGKLV